jgi:hypothetical protein
MQAPPEIMAVWNRFVGVPMETFTKGWWYGCCSGSPRQRTVAELIEHRRTHGAGGNCFDLALWLRQALWDAGIAARIIGHDLCTPEGHVAVIASDRCGGNYLCDLGDQWLQPILIDPGAQAFADDWHRGFFPGREVRISRSDELLQVFYWRAGGKVGSQSYDLRVLTEDAVMQACHHSQNLLRRPFCEMLLPYPVTGRIEHWEYDEGASFWKLEDGAVLEEPCGKQAEWVARISGRTGMSAELIQAAFTTYAARA